MRKIRVHVDEEHALVIISLLLLPPWVFVVDSCYGVGSNFVGRFRTLGFLHITCPAASAGS